MDLRIRIAIACACCLGLTSTSAHAGLLEILFGRPAAAPPIVERPPLEVTVRKAHRPKKLRKRAPAPVEVKQKLQTPIDIAQEPTWYLKDPTLRRGDIVVLEDRVLVFRGRRQNTDMDDFMLLRNTSLVSRKQKAAITAMTRAPANGW